MVCARPAFSDLAVFIAYPFEHIFDYDSPITDGGSEIGTNRRYASSIDKRMSEQVDEIAMREQPHGLTDEELDLGKLELTRVPVALPITAWVRFGPRNIPVRITGELVAYTSTAVAVRWRGPAGVQKCWVWASAVSRV